MQTRREKMPMEEIVVEFVYSRQQALVVQTLDSAIQRIYRYPDDSVIEIRNTYLLDSDLSGG